ncbi:MAG: GAF domain-containing sensor histidine kinase [Chloroflexota bacterium]|nr:GAF domain-containing sensor histidine kinase [Chloroflexota bacterium]
MQKQAQQHLKSLNEALDQLSKYTLPVDTRGALLLARQRLKQFERSLNAPQQDGLQAVYRVAQSLGTTLNLDEVLNYVMDAVIELTGAERGFLTLIEENTGQLSLQAARNIARETLAHADMEMSRSVIQSVVETGEGVVTTDAQSDPRFAEQESVIFYDLRSILCAPLKARGKIIGVIYVDNRAKSGIFGRENLDLLNVFAAQAAVAIENARLYTQTDKALAARVKELETLSQIDQDLNARLGFERALGLVREWATKGTGGLESWVFLTGEDVDALMLADGPMDGSTPAPTLSDVASFLDKPTPQILSPKDEQMAYLIAPLLHAGKTVGALAISREKGFSEEKIQFVQRLASRAATSIANNRLYQAVEQANRSKSQFLAIVTHELRIPLTSIKGYTDLILGGSAGAEVTDLQRQFLGVIRKNVNRMADLIADLADISRIERGILKLDIEDVSIMQCLQDTLDSLRHKIEERNQTLVVKKSDIPPVEADPKRVMQVLTNLVSNAWKYTPDGGMITIVAIEQKDTVRIDIQDTGIGISPEDQTKLFSQFFRSDNQAVRDQNGWGLGLNVTKQLVEMLAGEIGFESQLGEGSTFWFTLPVAGSSKNGDDTDG